MGGCGRLADAMPAGNQGFIVTSHAALEELFANAEGPIGFNSRAEAIPGDLRLSWRLAMLCIILNRSHGRRASMQMLHVLWWSVRSSDSRALFRRWHQGTKSPDELMIRFDPSLSSTLDLAMGQGLVLTKQNLTVSLTSTGRTFAEEVWATEGVLEVEKAFLGGLPSHMTQKQIRELLEWA